MKCVWPRMKLVSSGFSILTVLISIVGASNPRSWAGQLAYPVFYLDAGKELPRPKPSDEDWLVSVLRCAVVKNNEGLQ